MCGRCEGEPYRGVTALFHGDEQAASGFKDREEWLVVSSKVIVYVGQSMLANEMHPLVRVCSEGSKMLSDQELGKLAVLRNELSRPAIGAP